MAAPRVPDDLRYAKTHEWVQRDGTRFRVGITDHAQARLGDVVFVDLPAAGRVVAAGEAAAAVESVKAAADVYAPVAGTVVEANAEIGAHPEKVNADPYGAGWFFIVEAGAGADAAWEALLDAAAYRRHIASE